MNRIIFKYIQVLFSYFHINFKNFNFFEVLQLFETNIKSEHPQIGFDMNKFFRM